MQTEETPVITQTATIFATPCLIEADAPSRVVEEILAGWAAMHVCWTRFDAQSSLMQMNRGAGAWQHVEPLLAWALDAAVRASTQSGGAYDPTVNVAAIGYEGSWPHVTSRYEPRPAPGVEGIQVFDTEVFLPEGVNIDLGGIAKGLAVDWAANLLRENGCSSAVLSCGGDVHVVGLRDVIVVDVEGRPWWRWRVQDGGVATSSTQRLRWAQAHHIVDPASGGSVQASFATVSAQAVTCAEAEVACTTAYVTGDIGLAMLRTGAVLAYQQGELLESRRTAQWRHTDEFTIIDLRGPA